MAANLVVLGGLGGELPLELVAALFESRTELANGLQVAQQLALLEFAVPQQILQLLHRLRHRRHLALVRAFIVTALQILSIYCTCLIHIKKFAWRMLSNKLEKTLCLLAAKQF